MHAFALRRDSSSALDRLAAALISALLATSALPLTAAPVAAANPLSITNVDSPDPVASGGELLYTIQVTNDGGAKISEVVLTDQINGVVGFGNPPLLDVVSSRGSCSQNNTQVTCTAGEIEGFGSWTITIRGVVTAAAGTTINNIATVTATKSAQTFTSSAAATTQVTGTGPGGPSPDLTIGKNGPLAVTPGSSIVYTLTIGNLGTANAVDVKVTDTLPAGIGGLSATATSLFACAFAGQTMTCTGGRVNAGANATITVTGTAPMAPGTLENTSVVDPDNTIDEGELGNTADAAELNNQSNTVITEVSPLPPPPPGPITLDKEGPATAVPGEVIDYTITVTNGTLGRADYITVVDGTQGLQAASLQVVSAVATSGTTPECTVAAPTVTCTMTRLATGGTLTIVIRGMVIAPAGSTIINAASVNANIKNAGYSASDEVLTIINPGIDLTITKVGEPDPVCASSYPNFGTDNCKGGLTYTFAVGNSGVLPAADVVVRDPLPPGTTFDAAASSPLCSEAGGIVTCVIPVINPGATVTLSIVLVAPPTTGEITNTVTVDPANAIFESDETNNVAVEVTGVSTGIDLSIEKVDSPPGFDPIATSGTQTWTITVENNGTQDATGIRVRDTLPSGAIFIDTVEDNGFTCSHTGGVVECIGGSIHGTYWETYLGNGPDSATIQIVAFAQPTVGTMHNEVRVDPLNEIDEYDETNNFEFEDTTVTTGDATIGAFNELSITKAASPDPVATSSLETYTVVVTNSGTDPAVGVVVRDFLPIGFTFLSAEETPLNPTDPYPFSCSLLAGNIVECTGATLDGTDNLLSSPDVPAVRTIVIRTLASSIPALDYVNTARVDPANAIPEGNEGNNLASATVDVVVSSDQFIDLKVLKDDGIGAGGHAAPNGLVSYTLTVTNGGTNPALNVTLRDSLPAGTTFVSAVDTTPAPNDGAFSCVHASGVISCTGATIDGSADLAGAGVPTQRTVTIVVRAPNANATITNQAVVDPSNAVAESNETNNTDTEDTPVQSNIDLELDKTGPGEVTQGTESDYFITVKNLGTQAATDVVVRDPLPVGLIPLNVTVDNGDWTCEVFQNPINLVECTGTLSEAGGSLPQVQIQIHVFVTQEGGSLDNEACVDPDDDILEFSANPDFNPDGNGNNCKTKVTVVVPPAPDMQITKDGPGSVAPGAALTYTLTAMNVGTGAAASAQVADDLPSDLTYVSATATNGWTCSEAATVVTCDSPGAVAPGDLTMITIEATVSATATLPIENTATVTAAGDTNAANNSATSTASVGGEGIDLVLASLSDSPDPVPKGDTLTYTMLVNNVGSVDASNVLVRATLNSTTDIGLASATASQGFACTPAGPPLANPIECSGDLLAGQSTLITIVLQINAGAISPLQLDVSVDPDDTIAEASELNNTGTEVTTLSGDICPTTDPCVDLVISTMLESNDPITVGDSVTYTVTIGNTGNAPATGVLVWFDVFGDVSNWAHTATNGFTCTPFPSGGQVLADCTGDLNAGNGTIIQITVTADSAGFINAQAEADPFDAIAEFSEGNNGPTSRTTQVDP